MATLESFREQLQKMAEDLVKKGERSEVIEKELLRVLMEMKKQQQLSIPELEELVKRTKDITDRLKNKVEELNSLTSRKA